MGVQTGSMNIEGATPWIYGKWVVPPAQNRSEKTFFRFLDAAEELLTGHHWHEVSVQQIVKKARASVGSFYNRFHDKEALLHCLDDRLGQECELTITQLVTEFENCPALAPEAPSIIMSLLIRLCHERRGVIRALDLATKMSTAEKFAGLGPRFESALETLAIFLSNTAGPLEGLEAHAIAQGFRDAFWTARENLLYDHGDTEEETSSHELHASLMRHFEATVTPGK